MLLFLEGNIHVTPVPAVQIQPGVFVGLTLCPSCVLCAQEDTLCPQPPTAPHGQAAPHRQDTGRAQPCVKLGPLCRLGVLPRALWNILECSLINLKES